jgi:transcriptional regulator with XRE-family HTH domain
MSNRIDISEILKGHRRRLGYSQSQMALLFEMARHRYASYEEDRARPGLEDLLIISRKLGYKSIDAFIGISESRAKPTSLPIEKAYITLPADKKKIVDFILQLK